MSTKGDASTVESPAVPSQPDSELPVTAAEAAVAASADASPRQSAPGEVAVAPDEVAVAPDEVAVAGAPTAGQVSPWWVRQLARAGTATGWALIGGALFVGLWLIAVGRSDGDLPTPWAAFSTFFELLGEAFYDGGGTDADKGVGYQLLTSLRRVFSGFALAALVGVPFGLLLGGSRRAWQAANPIVQVLRPVSPLAWYPLGLVVLKNIPSAIIFVIFITALWPTVLNSATGAASVPEDQRNVARVFRFSRVAYVRHIVVPHSLPSIVTGLRLSMGIGWMVIVAAEMLAGGTGIGFYVWDSYNAGSYEKVISAILFIGFIGVILDALFLWLSRLVGMKESEQ